MSESVQSSTGTQRRRAGQKQEAPRTDRQRLEDLAAAAIQAHALSINEQIDYVWDHVEGDIHLLTELFTPYRLTIIGELVRLVRDRQRAAVQKTSVGGSRSSGSVRPTGGGGGGRAPTTRPNLGARVKVTQRSMLDDFPINGRAIGEVTVQEAREWLQSNRRDGRFVELVIAGLPEDGSLIKKHITATEANAFYRQAEDGK